MKKLTLAAVLLTGTAITLPAQAEVFNGLYIGAEAGYDKDAVHVDGTHVQINNKSDLAYGVIAGVDMKVTPHIVAGIEGDMSIANNDFNFSDGVTVFDSKAKRTLGISGRLGYLLANRILLYGRAGYTNGRFRFRDGLTTTKENFDGFRYGGGVELAVLPNIGVRAEYTHTNYNSGAAPVTSTATNFSPNTSRIMLGAAFYF